MSDNNVSIDTDAMKSGLNALNDAGDLITSIYYRIYAAFQQYAGCWGDDETGQQFALGYNDAAEQVLTGAKTAADSVKSTGAGVLTMVDGYTGTEADNVDAARKVNGAGDNQSRP